MCGRSLTFPVVPEVRFPTDKKVRCISWWVLVHFYLHLRWHQIKHLLRNVLCFCTVQHLQGLLGALAVLLLHSPSCPSIFNFPALVVGLSYLVSSTLSSFVKIWGVFDRQTCGTCRNSPPCLYLLACDGACTCWWCHSKHNWGCSKHWDDVLGMFCHEYGRDYEFSNFSPL